MSRVAETIADFFMDEEDGYWAYVSHENAKKKRMAENVRLQTILGGDVAATAAFLSRIDRLEARYEAWVERTGYSG